MPPPPPRSTLFPYTTLFRSSSSNADDIARTPAPPVSTSVPSMSKRMSVGGRRPDELAFGANVSRDRKSTRLNSSHVEISYAVFCLKKKKKKETPHISIHIRN